MHMAEQIPHLTALRAFEAAARHLSFQAAARELNLSPSAVSHQIRALEAYLDVRLFNRLTRAIELTPAGLSLQPGIENGFRQIETAVRQVRSVRQHAVLVVSSGPAMAAKWIMPRLYLFEESYPQIEVRLTTSNRNIDLQREDVDIAIRHGKGVYPGTESIRLFGEDYTPMCAPQLLQDRKHPLRKPTDLAKHRLLHDDQASFVGTVPLWPDWLKAVGAKKVDGEEGRHFKQGDHAVQAAIDGAGVLLGRVVIAAPDLAAGRLVRPFELTLPSDFGYFFVTRKGRLTEKPIQLFLEWFQAQARTFNFLSE